MKLMTNKLTILLVTLLATVSAASAMEQEENVSLLAGDENKQTQTRPNRSSSDARIVPSPFGPEDIGEVLDEIPLQEKESTESHTLLTDKPKQQESLWQKPARVLQNVKNTVQQKLSTSEKNKVASKDTNPSSRLPKIAQKGLDTLKRTKDFVAKKIQKPEVGEADHFVNQPTSTQEEINASIKFLQNFDETKNIQNVKGANYGESVRMTPEQLEQKKKYLEDLTHIMQDTKQPATVTTPVKEVAPAPAPVNNTTQVSELPIVETNLKSSIEEQKAQLENAFGFKDSDIPTSNISQPAPKDTIVDTAQDELASTAAELKARREALELKKAALQAKRKALEETVPLKTSTSQDKQSAKKSVTPAVKRVKTPGKQKNNAQQQPVQNQASVQDHKTIAFSGLQQALNNDFSNFPKATELFKILIAKGYSIKDILKSITEFAPQSTVKEKLMFIEDCINIQSIEFAERGLFKRYGLSDEVNNGPAVKTTVTPASNDVPAATKVTQLPVDPAVKKAVINNEPAVKQPEAPKATTPATKQVDQTPLKATQPASKDTTAAAKATQPPVDPAVKGTQVPADQQQSAGNNNVNQPQPLVLHADIQQVLNNTKITLDQLTQELQNAGFSPQEISEIHNNGIYENKPYSLVKIAHDSENNAAATEVMKKATAKIRQMQLDRNPSLAKLVGNKSVVEFENELADCLTKQCGCNAIAADRIITAIEQEGLQSQVIKDLRNPDPNNNLAPEQFKNFIQKIEQLEKLDAKKPSKFTVMNKVFIIGGGLTGVALTAGIIWKAVEYLRGANIKKTEAALNELEQLVQDANSIELLAEQYPFIKKQLIVLDADAKSVLNTLIERQETDSILAAIAAHKKELAQLQKQSFMKRIAYGVKRDMQRVKSFFGFGKKQVPAAA